MEGSVEQQDDRGWTPIMWSSCNGYPKLVRQLIQQRANVGHFGQARNGSGTTSALHECAAMAGDKGQSADAYYECAWMLMAAGQSPFKERSDGCTAIDVAARFGQRGMKSFLEGCALFRGNLMMAIPVTFGTKLKTRYCIVHPRFPFTNAAPTLWMTCYRSNTEVQPVCTIPLGNARVVIEGSRDSSSGILIIPSSSKLPKNVAIRSHTQNSSIVEITACGTTSVPAWKNLRTLADVCKAAGVAISCHSLDQLCAAALQSAVKQMHLPGSNSKLQLNEPELQSKSSDGAQSPRMDSIKEEQPQIADSAQEMAERSPKPAMPSMPPIPSQAQPDIRSSASSQLPRRSSGIGRMFRSAFRLSTSSKPKYNNQLLDSSSSLGQASVASTQASQKKGLFGLGKSSSSKLKLQSMASINESQGSQISQNIPDKFWSKMGREMSGQNGQAPKTSKENIESWFHEDDGIVSHPNSLAQQKGEYKAQDLNELMFPSMAKEAPSNEAPVPAVSPQALRRQTSDGTRFKPPQSGAISFVLEEPIVPTVPLVPSGPRRSFSFDDLDDFMSGGNRKARGHREGYADQLSPAEPKAVAAGVMQAKSPSPNQSGKDGRVRALPQALPDFAKKRTMSMPRRSFSFQGLDQLLTATEAQVQAQAQQAHAARAPRSTIDEDLLAWQKLREQRGVQAKKGPMIDPASYGGFQGAYAPEWREYTPPAARPVPAQQKPLQLQRSTEQPGTTNQRQPVPRGQPQAQAAGSGGNLAPNQQPSRRPSQPLAPQQGLQQVKGVAPNQGPIAAPPSPRQGYISPALQSAQRHAQESQLQQRKSAGTSKPVSAAKPQQVAPQAAPTPGLTKQPSGSRGSQGGDKKPMLADYLIGPELANLAALRALETGTLSTGSPRKSLNSSANEILGSVPVTKSEKRRKSKDKPAEASPLQPRRRSKDLLGSGSGSQRGSAPATPRGGRPPPVTTSGASLTGSQEAVIRTRSGRTPAERRSPTPQPTPQKENTANNNDNQEVAPAAEPTVNMPVIPESTAPVALKEENLELKAQQEQSSNQDARRSSAASAQSSVTHGVPSALFHGVKAPKFATPPTRIAPVGDYVPEIPEERSSREKESSPERPSVGFGA